MLIAYIDEFGHQGPYVSHDHKKYNTHPCFGYAGYILPASNVRRMGGYFKCIKERLLEWEIKRSAVPRDQWEKKGASLLTTGNISTYGDEIKPALHRIYQKLGQLDGELFFFGQQKPLGPVSQTHETSQDRESHCLIQAISRLGTIASKKDTQLMVIMDATDTHNRARAVATLGATIYSRSNKNKETRSVIEIPLQTESHLYATVQLADWTCALMGRLTDYHFAERSEFSWSVDLGRDIFKRAHPSANSIIWSNAPTKDSKCFPNQLVDTTPFWKVEQQRITKQKRKREKNDRMLQSVLEASSPEFRRKYNIKDS